SPRPSTTATRPLRSASGSPISRLPERASGHRGSQRVFSVGLLPSAPRDPRLGGGPGVPSSPPHRHPLTRHRRRVMSDVVEFQPWPKIARINKPVVFTEKIDGTNAAIGVRQVPLGDVRPFE